MKHYETELPEGYRQVYEIDAKDKKTAILLNLVALVVLVLSLLPFLLSLGFRGLFRLPSQAQLLTLYVVLLVSVIAYMVLHELVHGAVYKLLTHQKLTFGLSLSCAYCGVPDIYVYRTASLLAILAPFVVFTILFLPLALLTGSHPVLRLTSVLLFCANLSGCVGDLYGAALMLFRFRDPKLLVRDTGPKQTYYLPE